MLEKRAYAKHPEEFYQYCIRCDANLTLQKGYSEDLDHWVCKGCGAMLINPARKSDITWFCDRCGETLNLQEGFCEEGEAWECTNCSYVNKLEESEVYDSTDEYLSGLQNPYRGMADRDVLEILQYEEIGPIGNHENIILVRDENNTFYIKKVLTIYDGEVFRYLLEHPIHHMPRLLGVYEGIGHLVVIEEYIPGDTLEAVLENGVLDENRALFIAEKLLLILSMLHKQERPIIHRDLKPSNVIINQEGEIYLLDMNVAKWYKEEEKQDTRLLGTMYYAAPEQLGYGFSASNTRTDIYALGVLLNVMLTGRIPKEEKAAGPIWNIIEKCIALNPEERYDDEKLLEDLKGMEQKCSDGTML